MIQGILVINLDPPYVGFSQNSALHGTAIAGVDTWRHCTIDQIKNQVIDLNALTPLQQWPHDELS